MKTAVVALGSNLNHPQRQLTQALAALAAWPSIHIVRVSSFYTTKPVGYVAQPDFINAVLILQTSLSALSLLNVLQGIEVQFGRVRHFRNAPRTLDLDLIDYHGQIQHDERLILPHPRAHERSFVMVPLAEIAPDYRLAHHGTAADIVAVLQQHGQEDDVVVCTPPWSQTE